PARSLVTAKARRQTEWKTPRLVEHERICGRIPGPVRHMAGTRIQLRSTPQGLRPIRLLAGVGTDDTRRTLHRSPEPTLQPPAVRECEYTRPCLERGAAATDPGRTYP